MTLFKGLKANIIVASLTLLASVPAWAQTKAIEHSKNTLTLVDILVLIFMVGVFGCGVLVLGYTCWRVAADYIWDVKQGQEGKIKFNAIILGLVLGGFMVAPSGAFIIGQSIGFGDTDAVQFEESDFRKPDPNAG